MFSPSGTAAAAIALALLVVDTKALHQSSDKKLPWRAQGALGQ